MNALIYITLSENINYSYEKELVLHIKENYPDIVTFDLDNHSETFMFNYSIELLEKSEKAIIIIETEKDFYSSKTLILFERVLKYKGRCLVIMNGENKMLNKLFSQLNSNLLKNLMLQDEIKAIEQFI